MGMGQQHCFCLGCFDTQGNGKLLAVVKSFGSWNQHLVKLGIPLAQAVEDLLGVVHALVVDGYPIHPSRILLLAPRLH
jgi:hypothetical protein